MSSPSVTTGFNYYGSAAQFICVGPVDILEKIENGDTVIWQGPIMREDSMDGDGRTVLTTSIGTIRFYWGTTSQTPDSLLAALVINQGDGAGTVPTPAYKRICYAVLSDCAFGGQTTPPTLIFHCAKFSTAFELNDRVTRARVTAGGTGYVTAPTVGFTGGGGTGAAATATVTAGRVTAVTITNEGTGYTSTPTIGFTGGGGTGAAATAYRFNELSGDCVLPEVIYEMLTDTFYGGSVPTASVEADQFEEAALQIIEEDLGVSIFFDDDGTVRGTIGKLMPYIDGAVTITNGKFGMTLIRKESLVGLTEITDADLLDEPVPSNDMYEGAGNNVQVIFTERDNKYETATENYAASFMEEVIGRSVPREVRFPFVMRRSVAKAIAPRVAMKYSSTVVRYNAKVKPYLYTVQAGDVVLFSSAKLGISQVPCRVEEISVGGPDDPDVDMVLLVERTRDTSHDYVPPTDFWQTPGTLDPNGGADFDVTSVTPRLAQLPDGLLDGKLDGVLVAYDRGDSLNRRAGIAWTWDELLKEYTELEDRETWTAHGQIIGWERSGPTTWIMRVLFASTTEVTEFVSNANSIADFYFVTTEREVNLSGTPTDTALTETIWGRKVESGYFAQVSALIYDVEVSTGSFESDGFREESLLLVSRCPSEHVYFGRQEDFAVFPTDSIAWFRVEPNSPVSPVTGVSLDTGLVRYVKVAAANHVNAEEYSDVDAATYDALTETLTPNWGPRALTMAELIDEQLGQYYLLTTAASYSRASDLDSAGGAVYDGTETDEQYTVFDPADRALGRMFELSNRIYSDNP